MIPITILPYHEKFHVLDFLGQARRIFSFVEHEERRHGPPKGIEKNWVP